MIKKGESVINVKFLDNRYTNKLFGENINLSNECLEISYEHYSKRKRNNFEDTDFEILLHNANDIDRIIISDTTIINKLEKQTINSIKLNLGNGNSVSKKVSGIDLSIGFIDLI